MRKFKRDLYSILGVEPDATQDDIKDAYLSRARVLHPDRFDQKTQSHEWQKANEMLAELNDAYSVLRNPETRKDYNSGRTGTFYGSQTKTNSQPPPQNKSTSPQPPPFELGELTPGYFRYSELPEITKEKLRNRQSNKNQEQFQIKLQSVTWNYIFIFILQCWFWYLFNVTGRAVWQSDTILWYVGFSVSAGALIGLNIVTIIKWNKVVLKPYFYITSLYFIKTEFDVISIQPLWQLKDTAITHNYKNGIHQNTDVVLKFDGHNESLTLSSKKRVEEMMSRLQGYDTRIREEFASGNYKYFKDHDDFYKIPRSSSPLISTLPKKNRYLAYGIPVAISLVALTIAFQLNQNYARRTVTLIPVEGDKPTLDEIFNKENTASVQNNLPSGKKINVPEGFVLEKNGSLQRGLPSASSKSTTSEIQLLPSNGKVQNFTKKERIAPFQINAGGGANYLLKLVDTGSNKPALTVFVRNGSSVKVKVPLGSYEVRYASGEDWYGYKDLFGVATSYSKAEQIFNFETDGKQLRGYSITLYKVPHGNLHTRSIRPSDF